MIYPIDPTTGLKSFGYQFPLRLSEDGEIGNLIEGDLAIYLRHPLRILNESAESVVRQAAVIIEALHEGVIQSGAGLLIESISAH